MTLQGKSGKCTQVQPKHILFVSKAFEKIPQVIFILALEHCMQNGFVILHKYQANPVKNHSMLLGVYLEVLRYFPICSKDKVDISGNYQ